MLCAISGEAPQVPVASTKSGNVFEQRLIEAYISDNGTDPVTGEDLSKDDLVELKSSRTVRPRPPTLTSIPSLLSIFQNEWDALALETHTLRQQLTQTRQELSRALYEHDAALRVITRLAKERDEARDALSKVTVNGSAATNGDSMEIDRQGLPDDLVEEVKATQDRLSKTRRKRTVSKDWATPDSIQSYAPLSETPALFPGARMFTLHASGDLVLSGGNDGNAGVYSLSQRKLEQRLAIGDPVTSTLWAGKKAIIATSTGQVKIFEEGREITSFAAHAGEVTALALHPSGEILASVGVDKSFIFYSLKSLVQVLQIFTNSTLSTADFHPDGHLFAAGGVNGQIKVFDVVSGANAANFDESGPLHSISFSENGTWLASIVKGSKSVSIWDLRKSAQIKTLETGGQVTGIRWDYTGQYLATAGSSGITVQQYSKSTKEWSVPLNAAVPAMALAWGPKALEMVSMNEGVLTVLGTK